MTSKNEPVLPVAKICNDFPNNPIDLFGAVFVFKPYFQKKGRHDSLVISSSCTSDDILYVWQP